MIGRFMLLLLLLFLFAHPAHSTFRNRDSARTFSIVRYLQATALDSRISAASIANDIRFYCKAVGGDSIFAIHPKDTDGFRRLDVGGKLGFFIHGWEIRSRSNIWMLDILKTWASYERINVCVVDWSSLAQSGYVSAALNVFDVGLTVASAIESLEIAGLFHRSRVTLAGYSLGAHAAGFAGQRLRGEVDHIIGLDPAGPMFTVPTDIGTKYRLDQSDGKFVQVIHTSGGILGVSAKSGHADFYPNGGGSPQTNCAVPYFRGATSSRIVCSHAAAVKYFTYSMNSEHPYVGYDCRNYGMFVFGMCRSNAMGRFGIHTNRVAGSFYLITTRSAPYVGTQQAEG